MHLFENLAINLAQHYDENQSDLQFNEDQLRNHFANVLRMGISHIVRKYVQL